MRKCKKKGMLNLAYKQGLIFKITKEPSKFRETYKKIEQVKLVKVLERYSKIEVVINFK